MSQTKPAEASAKIAQARAALAAGTARKANPHDDCPKCGGELWWSFDGWACHDCGHLPLLPLRYVNGEEVPR